MFLKIIPIIYYGHYGCEIFLTVDLDLDVLERGYQKPYIAWNMSYSAAFWDLFKPKIFKFIYWTFLVYLTDLILSKYCKIYTHNWLLLLFFILYFYLYFKFNLFLEMWVALATYIMFSKYYIYTALFLINLIVVFIYYFFKELLQPFIIFYDYVYLAYIKNILYFAIKQRLQTIANKPLVVVLQSLYYFIVSLCMLNLNNNFIYKQLSIKQFIRLYVITICEYMIILFSYFCFLFYFLYIAYYVFFLFYWWVLLVYVMFIIIILKDYRSVETELYGNLVWNLETYWKNFHFIWEKLFLHYNGNYLMQFIDYIDYNPIYEGLYVTLDILTNDGIYWRTNYVNTNFWVSAVSVVLHSSFIFYFLVFIKFIIEESQFISFFSIDCISDNDLNADLWITWPHPLFFELCINMISAADTTITYLKQTTDNVELAISTTSSDFSEYGNKEVVIISCCIIGAMVWLYS